MQIAGAIVSDRFRLVEKLGEGGMGVTWKAFDQQTDQSVVIKFLKIAEAKDWKTIELFEREIDVLRSLDHPRIPDLIEGNADVGGEWFLVQGLATGVSVQSLIDRRSRFDEATLRGVADHVLDILVYLQGRIPPIVHRDVKPDNLIIDTDGSVRLVDFGAASLALTDRKLGGSTVVGTFGYMAPEQFRGISRAATDLYGLGMTLIVMATGMSPEQLETAGLKIQFEDHSTLSTPFNQWLARMVEPDADERFESAAVALDRLRNLGYEAAPDATPQRVDGDYLTRLHMFSLLRFDSLDVKRTNSGVNMIYRRKKTRMVMLIFTIVCFIMALAAFLISFIDLGVAVFVSLFAILIGGLGLNELIYKERLRFQDDGQWSWKKRTLLGRQSHVGTKRDIVRFDAAPCLPKMNEQSIYQITMNTYRGDFPMFSGLHYGEAIGIARELTAVTGIDQVPTERRGARQHAILAFNEALRATAEKGGILGGLAKAARRTTSLQRTSTEVNRLSQKHGSADISNASRVSNPTSAKRPATAPSANPDRHRKVGGQDEAHESLSYVFEPEDYEER